MAGADIEVLVFGAPMNSIVGRTDELPDGFPAGPMMLAAMKPRGSAEMRGAPTTAADPAAAGLERSSAAERDGRLNDLDLVL
jgi:hypothetical protein